MGGVTIRAPERKRRDVDQTGSLVHTQGMKDSPPAPRAPTRTARPRALVASRKLLGWREWVSLPDLGVPWIHAKLDTGARTSALHAEEIETVPTPGDGPDRLRFLVRADGEPDAKPLQVEADLLEIRWIKSSNGQREERPVIRTKVVVGGRSWPIELTLTARGEMGFQMLLGREGLRKRFAVDPARSWVCGIPEDWTDPDSPVHGQWLKRVPPKGKIS